LCHSKGLLRTLYTQNIDGLDFQTNIPPEKIVGVHGSMGQISCEFCKKDFPLDEFRDQVRKNIKDIYKTDPTAPSESTNVFCDKCKQPGLKPKTVLYGSSLPEKFFSQTAEDFPEKVDLLIVVGTSLTVGPANTLVTKVRKDCLRLIVNNEKVGEFLGIEYGSKSKRDIFSSVGCDESFALLLSKLGWVEDMRVFYDKLAPASQQTFNNIK